MKGGSVGATSAGGPAFGFSGDGVTGLPVTWSERSFCLSLHTLRRRRRVLLQPSEGTTKIMNWLILIGAGLCECGFTFCLGKARLATGWEAAGWYTGFVVVSALSMILLAKAAKTIPIGTAYPVWTGIGAIGTVLIGILVFKEPASFWRLFFIFTLIASVIGLRMV